MVAAALSDMVLPVVNGLCIVIVGRGEVVQEDLMKSEECGLGVGSYRCSNTCRSLSTPLAAAFRIVIAAFSGAPDDVSTMRSNTDVSL